MFPQPYRLTTKDVRYIQKQRNVIRTEHFGVLWIPQYPNRKYHQVSIYMAADTVKKAARRHALKRQLLEYIQQQLLPKQWTRQNYYKLFVFLNKKSVTQQTFVSDRKEAIESLRKWFIKEWWFVAKKLTI